MHLTKLLVLLAAAIGSSLGAWYYYTQLPEASLLETNLFTVLFVLAGFFVTAFSVWLVVGMQTVFVRKNSDWLADRLCQVVLLSSFGFLALTIVDFRVYGGNAEGEMNWFAAGVVMALMLYFVTLWTTDVRRQRGEVLTDELANYQRDTRNALTGMILLGMCAATSLTSWGILEGGHLLPSLISAAVMAIAFGIGRNALRNDASNSAYGALLVACLSLAVAVVPGV